MYSTRIYRPLSYPFSFLSCHAIVDAVILVKLILVIQTSKINFMFISKILALILRRRDGTLDCNLYRYPKFYSEFSFLVVFRNFGYFYLFKLTVFKLFNKKSKSIERLILVYHHWGFINYYLIPYNF